MRILLRNDEVGPVLLILGDVRVKFPESCSQGKPLAKGGVVADNLREKIGKTPGVGHYWSR
jgi:hypothetical protein